MIRPDRRAARGAVLLTMLAALGVHGAAPARAQRSAPAAAASADRRELEAATRAMSAAFARGDLRAVARFYADDAQLVGPGRAAISGRAAIDEFWLTVRDPKRWTLETRDAGGTRDEPWQLLRSVLETGDGMHRARAFTRCLLVWRRQPDGSLRIRLDIWNAAPHSLSEAS